MTEKIKEMNLSEMLFNRDERLLNYITNLQKDNEVNKTYYDFYKDMSDKWKNLSDVYKKNYKDYKQRNKKAVEYIKIYRSYENIDGTDYLKGRNEIGSLSLNQVDNLLNILQGGDEE